MSAGGRLAAGFPNESENDKINTLKLQAAVSIVTAYLGREKELKVTDLEWRAIASAYDYVAKNIQ